DPCLVAAWPGVGNVAVIAINYLKEKLKAKELGAIEPFGFFDPGGIFIKENIIDLPKFPESKFYYWSSRGRGKDMLILISEAQPPVGTYEYVNSVLDVAEQFGVKRVYTAAAALIEHSTDKPRVLGAATTPELIEDLEKYDIVLGGNFYVAGLNGLLLGAAKERDLEGICLLGETAKHVAKMPNARASLAVLNILTKMLGVEIDTAELEEFAESTEREIKKLGDQMRSDFLQHFTTPIWEREEEEGKG
ncbi:PAC2 family protein, partial [Chloroflexota bacterium]